MRHAVSVLRTNEMDMRCTEAILSTIFYFTLSKISKESTHDVKSPLGPTHCLLPSPTMASDTRSRTQALHHFCPFDDIISSLCIAFISGVVVRSFRPEVT